MVKENYYLLIMQGKIYLITTTMKIEFTGAIIKNKEFYIILLLMENILLYNKKKELY